jgi:type VI protein secretion system component VasK
MSWVDTYVSWCFFIAMAAPVLFVAVYLTMPWKESWEGRVLMLGQVVWIGFLLNGVLFFAVGEDYFGRDAFRILLFTALLVKLWGLTVLLIVRRQQGRALARSQRSQSPADAPSAPPETHPSGRRQPDPL